MSDKTGRGVLLGCDTITNRHESGMYFAPAPAHMRNAYLQVHATDKHTMHMRPVDQQCEPDTAAQGSLHMFNALYCRLFHGSATMQSSRTARYKSIQML
jgi:hypothetical protein